MNKLKLAIIFITILSCKQPVTNIGLTASNISCQQLKTNVSQTDEMNSTEDAHFGEGDDNLFTAGDFKVYKNLNRTSEKQILTLNDYNLQTCYTCNGIVKNKADTLYVIIDFSNFKGIKFDTAVIIDELQIFNGFRKNKREWNKSIKAKDIEIVNHEKCICNVILENTYKMQWIKFEENKIAICSGTLDTIKLIIKSVYTNKDDETNFSLSEINFDGKKNY